MHDRVYNPMRKRVIVLIAASSVAAGVYAASFAASRFTSTDDSSGLTHMLIAADGEVTINSISQDGAGRVVCIKAGGTLGTCMAINPGQATCTCG